MKTIRTVCAIVSTLLVVLLSLPLWAEPIEAFAPASAESQGTHDDAPQADQQYTCTITYPATDPQCSGDKPCDRPFSGTFASKEAADERCVLYAKTHGGVCKKDCAQETTPTKTWSVQWEVQCQRSERGKPDFYIKFYSGTHSFAGRKCDDKVEKEKVAQANVPEWDYTDWFCQYNAWICS